MAVLGLPRRPWALPKMPLTLRWTTPLKDIPLELRSPNFKWFSRKLPTWPWGETVWLQYFKAKWLLWSIRIEMSELMMYKAAALKDAGKPFTKEAAMAKLACSETATFVSHQAIQVGTWPWPWPLSLDLWPGFPTHPDSKGSGWHGLRVGHAGGEELQRRTYHGNLRRHQWNPAPCHCRQCDERGWTLTAINNFYQS